MRIYTRQGDNGMTRLLGGDRVPKDDPRLEVEGCLDELASALGVAVGTVREDDDLGQLLKALQWKLFAVGAVLAGAGGDQAAGLTEKDLAFLETSIDRLEAELPPRRFLILPGGTAAAVQLHVARTICRRLERRLVSLSSQHSVPPTVLAFVNRLSDLLFVAARSANHRAGVPETHWDPDSSPPGLNVVD